MRIAELTALLHLASPALPIGAFSYSQGLEAAIEHGLVHDGDSAARLDRRAASRRSSRAASCRSSRIRSSAGVCTMQPRSQSPNEEFLASRESAELRRETQQMGWSLAQLCASLEWGDADRRSTLHALKPLAQPTAFAFAAYAHDVPRRIGACRLRVQLGRESGGRPR